MRYSLEQTYRRCVKGYGFLPFARKFGDKYGKKLMNTATKVGTSKYGKKVIDTTKKQGSEFAKTAGKRIVKKSTEATGDRDEMNKQAILKNNAPFISCTSKINDALVENAQDLGIIMLMYSLLKYSKNYSKTSASLWNYYRDELTDETNDNNGPNKNVINSTSFKYKTSIKGSTYNFPRRITDDDGNFVNNPNYDRNKRCTREVEIAVSLKYIGNFWNNLNILLVNCEVSLALSWSETCVITSMERRLVRAAQGGNPAVYGGSPEGAAFKIKDCKLYVPVVPSSAEINNKVLEQLKTGFKRTIKWNNIDQKCLIRLKITI